MPMPGQTSVLTWGPPNELYSLVIIGKFFKDNGGLVYIAY